ncbi:TMEM175 family protein [Amycolatopsis viridis]|uniref:Membrane protein n=1 Tax=Amycolatopsis viridis TaxID=185678 RepID=A0ABX0SRZ0_9PSEU|nr:TMEM175 family protein [Amycolatopsis viridis]NIH78419.1 putative membrane protein [Amycolatopsis viridis]
MSARPKTAERLVFFSDAVVAIALTLLVLPLVDAVPELVDQHRPASDVISQNRWEIFSFLLSFVVIGRQWMSHHHLFEHIKSYNKALVWLNLAWLLSVAVLPFPTELTGAYGNERFTVLSYIGTVFANTLCVTAMTLLVRRNPDLVYDTAEITPEWVFNSVGVVIALIAAFVLAALVPAVGYFSLFLLFVPPWVARARFRSR